MASNLHAATRLAVYPSDLRPRSLLAYGKRPHPVPHLIHARRHSGDRLSDTRRLDDAVAPLVRRAQAGDGDAREQLLRCCHGTVYRWALVYTRDPGP